MGNNTPECNYDGGDCCECTCEISEHYEDDSGYNGCREFACIDPDAECSNDDDITIDMFENCEYVSRAGPEEPTRAHAAVSCTYPGLLLT